MIVFDTMGLQAQGDQRYVGGDKRQGGREPREEGFMSGD